MSLKKEVIITNPVILVLSALILTQGVAFAAEKAPFPVAISDQMAHREEADPCC